MPGSLIGLDPRDPILAEILKLRVIEPASLARITWAIATNICRLFTVLMFSTVIFITSIPKRSLS
jgi:hypothetical protein